MNYEFEMGERSGAGEIGSSEFWVLSSEFSDFGLRPSAFDLEP